jgi:hypothetical protein
LCLRLRMSSKQLAACSCRSVSGLAQ